MTDINQKPRSCFKIGKYLLEGANYKNTMVRLINQVMPTGVFDLYIIFFDGYNIEKRDITFIDFVMTINDVCKKADNLPDDLKKRCVDDFILWRDTQLPAEIEESRREGKTVEEPEMDAVQ